MKRGNKKGIPMKAIDVAEYFLSLIDEDSGDVLTNLKIQKLLYYAQGFSLAILHYPLFEEKIIAWNLGPVVVEVYDEYKTRGSDIVYPSNDFDFSNFNEDEIELLNEVFEVYGQFSATALVEMTHKEPPWRDTRKNEEIHHKRLQNYFSTQTIDGKENTETEE